MWNLVKHTPYAAFSPLAARRIGEKNEQTP